MDIDLDKPVEPQVRRELVAFALKHLRLDLPEERRVRIEEEMRQFMDEGIPASYAFSAALDLELLLYGDPHVPDLPIVGILNNPEQ